MPFHAFQKIPTSTATYALTKKEEKVLFHQAKFVVLEKIHGSNFSVYHRPAPASATAGSSTATTTRFAKRTAFLDEGEWFYNYETITDQLTREAGALASSLIGAKLLDPSRNEFLIAYGELFGGFYPASASPSSSSSSASASAAAAAIPPWSGAVAGGRVNSKMECVLPLEQRAVQEGIYYAPDVRFVVFDIAIATAADAAASASSAANVAASGAPHFLNYDVTEAHLKTAGMVSLPRLFTGTFHHATAFNHRFDSTFATGRLGMPPLAKGSNTAEGVVLKPEQTLLIAEAGAAATAAGKAAFGSGSSATATRAGVPAAAIRCLVKVKHEAFAEISGEFTTPTATAALRLLSLVNGARVAALLSKHGRIDDDRNTVDALADLLAEDVWADFYSGGQK